MYVTRLASVQLPLWNMLKKYDVDPLPLFQKVRLDPELMNKTGARYPVGRVKALLREIEAIVKDPSFGLSIATSWHPSNFGVLGHVLLLSRTLRETLERLIRYHKVISDNPIAVIQEDKLRGTFSIVASYEDELLSIRIYEDAGLAFVLSILRWNYQMDLAPLSVDLAHHKPDSAANFYEYFQCPINFGADENRLTLSLDVVEELLPGTAQGLDAFSEQLMSRYLKSLSDHNLVTRVKKSIVQNLPSGKATVDNSALDLNMSKRSLQRGLKQENTSFNKLLSKTRMEMAMDYISDPKMDLTEIAFLLGFSELSSFSRSFKKWTGNPPAKYRKVV